MIKEEAREQIAAEVWCCSINLEMLRKGEPIRYLPAEFAEERDKQPYYEAADQILNVKGGNWKLGIIGIEEWEQDGIKMKLHKIIWQAGE